jgi:ribose transport system ATP-binding protein
LWLSRLYGQVNPVLILDEPTTVLLDAEVKRLFSILHDLKNEATIIFISHRLEEVIENSDRIVILKDGDFVTEMAGGDATEKSIEQLMVGHDLSEEHFRESEQIEPSDEIVIEVSGLSLKNHFEPIDFQIRKGEIVSFSGLIGSGKEELCECLAGIRIPDTGVVKMNGKRVKALTPKDTIRNKIGYIPIDRRKDGLATDMNVTENINMLVLDNFKKAGFLSPGKEKANAGKWAAETSVKAPSLNARCANLSGGNQQKVVLSKWLAAESQFLILDHPTRGIDVGAKDEIYHRIRALAKEGKSMLIMCDTLEEDIGLSNRMLIMKDGKLMNEVPCPGNDKPSVLDIISSIV